MLLEYRGDPYCSPSALAIPCVDEFKNGRGTFYNQESRSKYPMLFPRATIRLCPAFARRFAGASSSALH